MSETYAKEFEGMVEKAKAAKKPMRVALAGADGRYVWSEGEIRGKGVVLNVPAGLDPKRVKYAMAWPNAWATLFNAEGFPAWGFEAEVK